MFLQPNMKIEECYELGHITRTHGTRGELIFFLDVDDSSDYDDMDSVFLEIKGALVPYFIESINIQRDNKAIVRLEDVDSIEKAKALIGSKLFLPEETLDDLGETSFYYHEIIGFKVTDQQLGQLGVVSEVITNTAQDLIGMLYEGQQVLIPIHDDIVLNVDRTNKTLLVNLPDGLLDLYSSEIESVPDDSDDDEN